MEVLIVVILLFIGFIFFTKKNQPKQEQGDEEQFPYFKISTLLTPAELSFYHTLKIAVSEQYDIFVKVRLADLVSVQKSESRSDWQKSFNKIKAKHVDFTLTDKETSEILCAIELDDSSHARTDRQKRDDFLGLALKQAKLPLLRFKTSQGYQSKLIADKVKGVVESGVAITDVEHRAEEQIQVLLDPKKNEIEHSRPVNKKCPRCDSELVERKASKGQYAGVKFLGCSNFPQCRYKKVVDNQNSKVDTLV